MQQNIFQSPASQISPTVWQTAVNFLRLVLPTGVGFYSTSSVGANPGSWRDQPHTTVESMAQTVLSLSAQQCNTYFAMSGFREGLHEEQKPNGKTATVFRTQANAIAQRCLWLDIDCGKANSVYPNDVAAINALTNFLKQTGLPLPVVVSSGHGLHLYWPFMESVSTTQWLQMAGMLKSLCTHFQFDADHSRTMDAASVLRVPGTYNYDFKGKYDGQPKLCRILILPKTIYHVLDIAGTLVKAIKSNRIAPATYTSPRSTYPLPSVGAVPPAPEGLSFVGMEEAFNGPKRHPFQIIRKCRQIQQAGLGTYTQWYNMMLVMKHCAFGEQAVHDISKMDKVRYDYNNTQMKLTQAIEGGYGPCRCDTFNEKDPGICQSCPFWGKITSPLQLGDPYVECKPVKLVAADVNSDSPVVTASPCAPVMEVMPFNNQEFSVVPGKGVIWHKKTLVSAAEAGANDDEDHYITKDILICDVEIYVHSVCIDDTGPDLQRSYLVRKQAPGKAPEELRLNVTSDLGTQKLWNWLANNAMLPVHPRYNKQLSDFMSTYLASIQNKLPEVFVRDTFGWVTNHDGVTGESYPGFIVGPEMFTSRGVKPVKLTPRAAQVAESFSRVGNLEKWKMVPQMYRILEQPFSQLMMLTGFGAPFMKNGVGTATNVAYSLWDVKGGKGKSTVLEAVSSIWGCPKHLLQTKNDTVSSRFQKYAVHKNLPIFIDEVTNIREADLSDLIYDIVNGREKSRSLGSGMALARSGSWSTTTLFTSNKSLYEMLKSSHIQSDATCMRVVEHQCDFKDYTGTPYQKYIASVQNVMHTNYGLAGPAFLQYCFDHPEVMDEITHKAKAFAQTYTVQSDERFWMYGIGIPLAAGEIAVRAGLIDYDIPYLREWCVKVLLPSLREKIRDTKSSGDNLLSEFLNENISHTLSVSSAKRPSSQKDPGIQSGIDTYVKFYPVGALYIRHEQDTNTYYVSTKRLQYWCRDNRISMDVMLQELRNKGVYQKNDKIQYALGKWVSALDHSRSTVFRFVIPQDKE